MLFEAVLLPAKTEYYYLIVNTIHSNAGVSRCITVPKHDSSDQKIKMKTEQIKKIEGKEKKIKCPWKHPFYNPPC